MVVFNYPILSDSHVGEQVIRSRYCDTKHGVSMNAHFERIVTELCLTILDLKLDKVT